MSEESTGARRLSQVRYVVMELPKYQAGPYPKTMLEKWAYFFREAERLLEVPAELSEGPLREALEVARISALTPEELEEYEREKIAEQDARGMLTLAQREGKEQGFLEGKDLGLKEGKDLGLKEGLREAIVDLCAAYGLEVDAERRASLEQMSVADLSALRTRIKTERRF